MIDVIIPVHNIAKRGLARVYNSVYSLLKQDVNQIFIINSSTDNEFNILNSLLKFKKVVHVHIPSEEFNKPKLLNYGLKLSSTDYIFMTDADYVFKSDLLKVCKKHRSPNRILLKEVKMLKNMNITKQVIDRWLFPLRIPFNDFGKIADGAMQYAKREWFLKVGGYDERMSGLCGMDNDMHARAVRDGLEDYWVTESEILHQYHKVEKELKQANSAKRNWRLIDSDKTIKRNEKDNS